MKATCPNCQTSYRVADDKVPDVGAQIKCPKCETTFVVRRPAESPAAPASEPGPAPQAARHEQATPLTDLVGGTPAPPAPPVTAPPAPPPQAPAAAPPKAPASEASAKEAGSETPNLDALDGEAYVSVDQAARLRASEQTRSAARGMSAIRAQSGPRRAGRDPLEGFRVRTARGLTYDFPTRAAMERWLAEREELAGCEAAEPGGAFRPAAELLRKVAEPLKIPKGPKIDPAAAGQDLGEPIDPSRPIEVGHVKPLVPVLPGQPVGAGRARRPAVGGPRAGLALWTGLVLGLLLLAAGTAASLTRYGVVDFSSVLPLDRLGVSFPRPTGAESAQPAAAGGAPRLPEAPDPEVTFSRALGEGRQALRAKRFSRAALEFKRALGVHPGSVEALEGLARAYGGLGDSSRAREALEQVRKIKQR